MKIVIAVHHFPPKYTGGAEQRAYRTADALQKRGHTLQVITVERTDTGPPNGVAWEDDEYKGVPVRRLSFNRAAVPDPFVWDYDNAWIGDHLHTFLAEQKPDIFHLVSGYLLSGRALQVARQRGIPSVISLTDYWFLCPRITMLRSNGKVSRLPINAARCVRCLGEQKRRHRWLGQIMPGAMDHYWRSRKGRVQQIQTRLAFLLKTLNQVEAIISPSQFLRQVFVDAGIDPERIVYSRQGRDFPGLTPEALEKTPSSKLRIGYMGQIAPHKGVHVLFEAVRQLKDLPITVQAYGDPSPFPAYTAQLQEMIAGDTRLALAGVYERGQLTSVLQNLDAVVVPSVWYENSPNVILEAFAHRTPVIASSLGGMAELIRHEGTGLLFETENAADLARQLRHLAKNPGALVAMRSKIGAIKGTKQEIDELVQTYRNVRAQA